MNKRLQQTRLEVALAAVAIVICLGVLAFRKKPVESQYPVTHTYRQWDESVYVLRQAQSALNSSDVPARTVLWLDSAIQVQINDINVQVYAGMQKDSTLIKKK